MCSPWDQIPLRSAMHACARGNIHIKVDKGSEGARTRARNHQTRKGVPRSWSANNTVVSPTMRCTSHQRKNSQPNMRMGRCAYSGGWNACFVTTVAAISRKPNASHAAGITGSTAHCEAHTIADPQHHSLFLSLHSRIPSAACTLACP